MTSRRPQDLLLTLFGEFLLHRPGPVWVGSVIRLLRPLGLSEGAARTVLSRVMAKGWLEVVRSERRSYYGLSAAGRRLLEEGEARIHRQEYDREWDGEWTLVAYSIPEEARSQRDALRLRLTWLGFGSLGKGLWISPHEDTDRVRVLAQDLGVEDQLEVFRARHSGAPDSRQLIEKCWDLGGLNERYEAFIARHLAGCRELMRPDAAPIDPETAFVRRFELVHDYREFPLLDPFLPRPLQPPDFAGECSLALFRAYHELLATPADRYLEEIVETPAHAAAGADGSDAMSNESD
jgi:phenylacetic acid degradation operon negative regulatory protein